MPRRINPVVLLGLTIAIALSLALSAGAQSGGGSPGDAVGAAMGQVGKPYVFGTDGPDTFSCAGLVRFALRSAGVDENAPWGHGEYLGAYPNVSSPKPGDVVVYPNGVAMYVGDGTVVMANEADGSVGTYPMESIGTPMGFARPPYDGAADPAGSDPAASDAESHGALMGLYPTGDFDAPTAVDPAAINDTAFNAGTDEQAPVDEQGLLGEPVPTEPVPTELVPTQTVPTEPVPTEPILAG
ncbi:MAG: C40 family peptidase [Actinomycetota bacterium]|nr:C40 family peptidase [Actinomycetota bacterium]